VRDLSSPPRQRPHKPVNTSSRAEKDLNEDQGCQMFHDTTYQKRENIPNDHKIYQMATKYTKMARKFTQRPQNVPSSIISRPFKIYPNWDFWLQDIHTIWQP
jgi:hypothetical protein